MAMQEFSRNVSDARGIKEALRRNERMGNKRVNLPVKDEKNETHNFLEYYVFDNLNMSSQTYLGTLEHIYYSGQDFRQRRQRNIDFTRGRQLNESIYDAELQRTVSEYYYLQRRNIPHLQYNVISKLVRSLVGQFREINTGNVVVSDSKDDRVTEIANIMTMCLNRSKKKNKVRNKDANNFKEMLISGLPVFKTSWASYDNIDKKDVKIKPIGSDKFFVNPGVTDYDLDNLHTVGEIHDTSINSILTAFSNGDYERGQEIKKGYNNYYGNQVQQAGYSSQTFDGQQRRNQTFYTQGTGMGSYRYYEVWKKLSDFEAITFDPLSTDRSLNIHKFRDAKLVEKEVDAENARREELMVGIDTDQDYLISYKSDYNSRWYVMYITPWGKVLDVRESPFKSEGHPYSFAVPEMNGEIWGIVEEVLDTQKSMNRQIQQADAIIANSIKGMIFVPDTAIPDEYTDKEYLNKIKSVDGAAIYKVREGAEDIKPFQMYANSSNVSNQVQNLIGLYSGLVDEISGNYGAAQGKSSGNGTASGYALETQNAGLNVRDIMDNYLGVLVERDENVVSLIREGYTKEDYYEATGKELDPRELKGIDLYIEQSKGTNSPAHRLALEQELLQLVMNQLLPFDVYLDVSNNPVMIQAKQKLEEYRKNESEVMAQQQQGGGGQMPQQQQGGGIDASPRDQALKEAGGQKLIEQQPRV